MLASVGGLFLNEGQSSRNDGDANSATQSRSIAIYISNVTFRGDPWASFRQRTAYSLLDCAATFSVI